MAREQHVHKESLVNVRAYKVPARIVDARRRAAVLDAPAALPVAQLAAAEQLSWRAIAVPAALGAMEAAATEDAEAVTVQGSVREQEEEARVDRARWVGADDRAHARAPTRGDELRQRRAP